MTLKQGVYSLRLIDQVLCLQPMNALGPQKAYVQTLTNNYFQMYFFKTNEYACAQLQYDNLATDVCGH